MPDMAKKKQTGGKHQTPRKPVQLPADWLAVAQGLASARMTPTAWLIIDLIRREAEAKGQKSLPPLPWQPGGD
jgi:hypothetical protein